MHSERAPLFLKIATWGGVIFLHFPLLIIAIYAFNTEDAAFSFPPQGLTLKWFSAAATRSDPLGDLIVSSRRAANVQRALTKYGYGQLKPTGTVGPDTQAAIQKFERDRKLPVTGQISDRLVRELSAVTGQVID